MKVNEAELQRFYRMFHHGIEVAAQYADQSILDELRDFVPLNSRDVVLRGMGDTIKVSAKWFKETFKWSYDPALPRYNDIPTLLKTKVGRCGEWANVYTGVLNALGIKARYVLDWYTDHVWTEFWDGHRWVHVDSTLDNMIDQPYFYEDQWGKKFVYVLAFHPQRVADVTENYTRKMDEIRKRRKLDPIPDMLIGTWNSKR